MVIRGSEEGGGGEQGQWRPGKASELDAYLDAHPLTPEERAQREGGPIPELRLKPDVSVEAQDPAARELLGQLAEGVRSVAVRDPETGVVGVLVPADRYVQLVGKTLRHSSSRVDLEGRSFPVGLADADVEQVDPQVSWDPVEHRTG